MGKIILSLTLGCIVFVSGCASTVPSLPKYYQHVETLPYTLDDIQLDKPEIKVDEMNDYGVLLISKVFATGENDGIRITKYNERADNPVLKVAFSHYYYKELNGNLVLIKHEAAQTGQVGRGWTIPILTQNDINSLVVSSKENLDNYMPIKNGHYVYAGKILDPYSNKEALLGFLKPDSAHGIKGESILGDYDASNPSLVIMLKRNCRDFGYGIKPSIANVKIAGLPIQAIATCSVDMTSIEYKLNSTANDLLKQLEVNNASAELVVDKQKFELPLSGFSYADRASRNIRD
ncbi:hypothetical protein ACSEYT_01925 [Vibrio cidicii]|uniref:hypothetical protein n=1 Tax=Vibrio cidicii TaxID=1763883 RepID=UPI003F514A80